MFADSTTPGAPSRAVGTRTRVARTAALMLSASIAFLGIQMAPALAADINAGTMVLNGAAKTATISASNDNAYVTFAGTAGQRIQVVTSASTFTGSVTVTVYDTDGTTALGSWIGNGVLDTTTLANTGTYKVYIDPIGANTGQINVSGNTVANDLNAGAITTDGTVKSVTTTSGQNATATFNVPVDGNRYIVQSFGSTYPGGSPNISLVKPDGTTTMNGWLGNGVIDTQSFSPSGTYTIKLNPAGTAAGSINLSIWKVIADPTAVVGTSGSVSTITTAPGQNATATFTVGAGQRVMIQTTGSSYSNDPKVQLLRPDLSVQSTWFGNGLIDTQTLIGAGTYTIKVDPSGVTSGSIGAAVWAVAPDATTALNINEVTSTEKTLSTDLGQNAAFTFSATAGQRVQVRTNANTYGANVPVLLKRPDGTTAASWATPTGGGFLRDTTALSQTGTYTVYVDPSGKVAGSMTVQAWNVPADTNGGSLPLDATPVTLATQYGGMNSVATFTVAGAGQKFQFAASGNTYSSLPNVTVLNPSGQSVVSWVGNMTARTYTLSPAGTWTIVVDPVARSIGQLTVKTRAVPLDVDGGTLPLDGTTTTLTTTAGGQGSFVTINGTAGQRVQLRTSGSTYAPQPTVSLFDPDHQPVDSWYGNAIRNTVTFQKTGTYKVEVAPGGESTGSITVRGWTVPADIDAGTLALDGTPTDITTVAGQRASTTFTATAGQRVMIQTLGSTYDTPEAVWLVNPINNSVETWYGNHLTDVVTLKKAGTWTVVVAPVGRSAGSVTVEAWDVPADVDAGALTVGGAAKVMANTAIGQNVVATFDGTADDQIVITTTNSTFDPTANVELVRPNGVVIWNRYGEFATNPITLPVTGAYSIVVDPRAKTIGSVKVKLSAP